MAIVDSLLDLVGNTSLLKLRSVVGEDSAEVWVKLEQQNPGGSVKDRIALAMLERAEREGRLARGGTVIEPTSGNTGIGLALACAVKGYKLVLTMPESMSLERRALLSAYGVEVVLTSEELQMDGAIARAHELAAERGDAFIPSQFRNEANPATHEEHTGPEVLRALGGAPDAFVAAVGTGGTITGVGRCFAKSGHATRMIAVEPESCATLSRDERGPTKIQGIGAGFVPSIVDRSVIHEVRTVSDERAWETKLRLARSEGLLVGISAGANVAIALDVARELGAGKRVVTMLCDTGERYFSLAAHFDAPSADGAVRR
ncbi:MAG: cysteine synthase A [Myxococcales bacterium]|nr:cysteine synthase A [Myxococcales bacterium]